MRKLNPAISSLIENHKSANSGSCQAFCASLSEALGYERPTEWERFWNTLQKKDWEHVTSWVQDNGGILHATATKWFGELPGLAATLNRSIVSPQSVIIVDGVWSIERSDGRIIEWSTDMNICSYFIVGDKGEFYFGGHGEGLIKVITSNVDIYMAYDFIPKES